MRMKVINRNGKWYRKLRVREMVLESDYVDVIPDRVKSFRMVQGSAGYSVEWNRKHFRLMIHYYREIDPLLGHMVIAREKARNGK